jgi:hypothetical protein
MVLVFDAYEGGGRTLLGRLVGSACRTGYGLHPLRLCEGCCAYCGARLDEPYEAWLNLSVDHVVPTRSVKELGYPPQWVEDLANIVACCRSCNEFLNGYRVTLPLPTTEAEFFDVRDSVFLSKRDAALARHGLEREWYDSWRSRVTG